ncbi:AN1-type zinc finger protein 1-like [Palaemon carinicauda]|uniref:AN1-type zinc finger protein 1-like n=1 Tax=Palaemon carinicauda TaxID=392227 RepID=UPI0035B58E82
MEFPELGKQCQVSSCQQLDFLPIKCHFCSALFCKDHFPPQYHDCTGDYNNIVDKGPGGGPLRYPCELQGCKDGELAPVICIVCSKNFCLAHRHRDDHGCATNEPQNNTLAEAAAKVQKITERLDAADSKKGQGRKSDKLSAKVQLMKLKQKSLGQGDLPQDERLYFLVFLPKTHSVPTQAVYVSHHWSIGKSIDTIATISKVPNRNNVVGADKLVLFRASDGSHLGAMDVTLKSLVNEGELFNGQSLIMEYVGQSTTQLVSFKSYKI